MKKNFYGMMIAAVMGLTVLGSTTGVSAAEITKENAQKTALEAVGAKAEDVIFKNVEMETDDGRMFYEVDFFIPGEVKYGIDVDAATGAVTELDVDLWHADDDFEYAVLIENAGKGTGAADGKLTELEAKTIALRDAGFDPSEVTFTECKRDVDDGIEKFELEFRTADRMEHEYEISAADGTILKRSGFQRLTLPHSKEKKA